MSPESSEQICTFLKNHFTDVRVTVIKEENDLKNLVRRKPDLVFSGEKYIGFTEDALKRESSDKIWLSKYLEENGINYTGSKSHALELEFDKYLAKEKVQKDNVNTAPYFIASPGQYKEGELPVPFPLFVKPVYEGNGKGIGSDSIVTNFENFEKKVEFISREFQSSSLIEKYLSGREFTVGVFDAQADADKMAMPVEIVAAADEHGNRILSFETKSEDNEQLIPVLDPEEHERISDFAKKAFVSLGARDYGRVDVRMDENGVLYFLEANLLPGLNSRKSYFVRSCKANTKMTYDDVILKIVETALKRNS